MIRREVSDLTPGDLRALSLGLARLFHDCPDGLGLRDRWVEQAGSVFGRRRDNTRLHGEAA